MYYYSTVDKVVLYHTAIERKNRRNIVTVRFERPAQHGFDFAVVTLPKYKFIEIFGFSEVEIANLTRYLKDNSKLIWDFAGKGGGENA